VLTHTDQLEILNAQTGTVIDAHLVCGNVSLRLEVSVYYCLCLARIAVSVRGQHVEVGIVRAVLIERVAVVDVDPRPA
jgi:hypothetical protein